MKRYFKEEHYLLRDMVREFAINEIRPQAKDVDKGNEVYFGIIKVFVVVFPNDCNNKYFNIPKRSK